MSRIRFTQMRVVAKKEIIEFIRDWRTIVALILVPLLLFPLLFIAFPLVMQSEAQELQELDVDVLVQSDYIDSQILFGLNESNMSITIESLPSGLESLSQPLNDSSLLRSYQYDAILRLQQTNDTWIYSVLYLSTSEQSTEARNRVLEVLNNWETNETIQRIEAGGLDADSTLNPLRWDGTIADADVATKGEQAGLLLSLFIPFVLALWTASAAVQPAIDMTVGERERGTLEALLSLPLSRSELLMGKWLAVVTITGVGVALQVAGLLFGIAFLAEDLVNVPSISIGSVLLLTLAVGLYGTMI